MSRQASTTAHCTLLDEQLMQKTVIVKRSA